ncbi:MAG: hypothetical protein ACOC0X_01485 [Halobacteriota archaeon]
MNSTRLRAVFTAMIREEWRLHSRLFSGHRFAAFPVFVLVVVAGAVWLLTSVAVPLAEIVLGIHLLALLFGLHTGSIGFVGRDALRNLLGDVTLVVFSARTLPIGRGALLLLFLAKDVAYYGVLFLGPMALGIGPALHAAGYGTGAGIWYVWWLWVSLGATFLLGLLVTLTAIGITSRGVRRLVVAAVIGGTGLFAWWFGVDFRSLTPLGPFRNPEPYRLVVASGVLIGLGAAAAITFDPTPRSHRRQRPARFRRWLSVVRNPVATRTLIEVHRSAGGMAKLLVSGAVLFVVGVGLLTFATTVTGTTPAHGPALGAILGLTGFTSYNWLTQGDDAGGYLVHPLELEDVIRGKSRAFAVVAPVVALVFYGAGSVYYAFDPVGGLAGIVVLLGVTGYTFGLTVYLSGLWPNEFLYDTALFALLWVALGSVLVPLLVVALVFGPLGPWLGGLLGAAGLGLGALGAGLSRVGARRWARRYRVAGAPGGTTGRR